jgi:hypothetical protein
MSVLKQAIIHSIPLPEIIIKIIKDYAFINIITETENNILKLINQYGWVDY